MLPTNTVTNYKCALHYIHSQVDLIKGVVNSTNPYNNLYRYLYICMYNCIYNY